MKNWFSKLDDYGRFIISWGGLILLGLTLKGIYDLLNKLIDKL